MKLFFVFACTLLCITSFSQQKISKHATQLQLEALGPGSLFSVNLDCRFAQKQNGLGLRMGLGGSPLGTLGKSCNSGAQISLPIGLNYLIGKHDHYLELGAGIVPTIIGGTKMLCIGLEQDFFSDETQTYEYVLAGYRYQPVDKSKITYRAFVSPLLQSVFPLKLWGGLSIGVTL